MPTPSSCTGFGRGPGGEAEVTRSRMWGRQCTGRSPSDPGTAQSSHCWRRLWGVLTCSHSSGSAQGHAPHTPPALLQAVRQPSQPTLARTLRKVGASLSSQGCTRPEPAIGSRGPVRLPCWGPARCPHG